MTRSNPFIFREEEKPRFKLRTASIFALLLMLLLFLGMDETDLLQLSAEELRVLEEQRQEQQREMTFRFMEEPPEEDYEPEDPRFLSDATRRDRSREEETEPENNDPVSTGNTLEMEQSPPVQQPDSTPVVSEPAPEQEAEPTPEELTPDEPEEPKEETAEEPTEKPVEDPVEEHDLDVVEDAEQHAEQVVNEARGNVPTDPGAPKPFRRLSKSEREAARQRAQQEMKSVNLRQAMSQDSSFHNPKGRSAPYTGLSVETNRSDLGEYMKILKQLIRGNWRIPNIARYEVSGFAVVSFKIHKDGKFSDAAIITPSGYEPLDSSSLNAVINTYKAPPLPQHVEEEWIPIKFGFFYNMRPNY